MFDCPVCRKVVKLDENGIDTLPRNRLLKKMVDMFSTQTLSSQQLLRKSQNFTEMCESHEKELGAFCSVCWEAVCIDCITGDHRGHAIESVDDMFQKQQVKINDKFYQRYLFGIGVGIVITLWLRFCVQVGISKTKEGNGL
jgi:hypothetical protein